jgi:putative ABC transport system permease protein
MAGQDGLTIESRRGGQALAAVRTGATAAGVLLALGVLSMTVGLIRAEAAGDLRTLTAAGAPSGVRRGLTAATAGALAVLGAVLGGAGAYLALVAAYWGNLGQLAPVPAVDLAVIVAGLPLLAAGAGWLLAGREPDGFSRVVVS